MLPWVTDGGKGGWSWLQRQLYVKYGGRSSKFIWLHVTWCGQLYSLAETPQPPAPSITLTWTRGCYWSAQIDGSTSLCNLLTSTKNVFLRLLKLHVRRFQMSMTSGSDVPAISAFLSLLVIQTFFRWRSPVIHREYWMIIENQAFSRS